MAKLEPVTTVLLACVAALAGGLTATRGEGPDLPPLNRKVVKFAEDHQGQQVGDGECWTLAADALTSAGARRPGLNGVPVYEFGRKLDAREPILPGDIVQFEKAVFVQKIGAVATTYNFPHHTAVITRADGKTVTLLHQNFGGKRTVQLAVLDLDARTEGTATVFRPVDPFGRTRDVPHPAMAKKDDNKPRGEARKDDNKDRPKEEPKADDPEEQERKAGRLLLLARMNLEAGKDDKARARLQEVLQKYNGTRAADEARKLLDNIKTRDN